MADRSQTQSSAGLMSDEEEEFEFKYWAVLSGDLSLTDEQSKASTMTFTMPDSELVLVAVYDAVEKPHDVEVTYGLVDGKESASHYKGETVHVASIDYEGLLFDYWVVSGVTLTDAELHNSDLDFQMPDNDVTFFGVYKSADVQHKLTVENGAITSDGGNLKSGYFYMGTSLEVTADAIEGKVFDHWDAEGMTLTSDQKTASKATIEMPDNDAKLTAVYRAKSIPGKTGDPAVLTLLGALAAVAISAAAAMFAMWRRKA